jgi:hypothetical protein
MVGKGRPRALLAPWVVLLAAVSGCAASGTDSDASAATPVSSQTPPPLSESPPATSSGTLTKDSMPQAADLGPGWQLRIEESDAETGLGNGTPYQSRDPYETAAAILPLGCEQRTAGPIPSNVLQATYQGPEPDDFAVALRLRFTTAAEADTFTSKLLDDLRDCARQPEDPYSGAPAPVQSVTTDQGAITATYQQAGEPELWTKHVQLLETDVLSLDANAPFDRTGVLRH